MTPEQRRTGNIAALYGYKVHEDTVAAESFSPGDGAIVLTAKGEPVMSGTIEEVKPGNDMMAASIKIGDMWYYEGQYKFRDL